MASNKSSIRVQAPKARPGGKPGGTPGNLRDRMTPSRILVLALAAAVVIAGILIGVSVAGSSSKSSSPETLTGEAQTIALLQGIPQQGNALGKPDAPVTLVEFADPSCPYCRQYALNALPTLVQEYVRPGKLRLVYNGLDFVGPASPNALRAIEAAGAQNRAWFVIDLLYRNQGDEQTNWATTSFLRALAETVPNLDAVKMFKDMGSSQTTAAIKASQAKASAAGVHQTPTFFVGLTGKATLELPVQSLDPSAFTPTIDGLLAK
jgi:protein-disulfide isomerase